MSDKVNAVSLYYLSDCYCQMSRTYAWPPSLQGEGGRGAKISVIRNRTFDQACLTESLPYDYSLCSEPQYKELRLWSARYRYDLLVFRLQLSFKTTIKLYDLLKTKLTHSGNLDFQNTRFHNNVKSSRFHNIVVISLVANVFSQCRAQNLRLVFICISEVARASLLCSTCRQRFCQQELTKRLMSKQESEINLQYFKR